MNISDMLYSLYLFEGFKDDVLNAYLKKGINVKSNKDFMNAVSLFNSNSKIKDDIKKHLGSISNIGYGVADRFSPTEFINLVNGANQKYTQLNQKGLLKSQARLAASSASDDYYLYPCRTFEEAHNAAFSHIGNLKRLSREERKRFFKELYGIVIPKPRTHYKTKKTPELMLEFMKECPVFMEPTWCVCANKNDWNDYKLEASKDEPANCFVVISKTHPNVRFCVTRNMKSLNKEIVIDGDYVISKKGLGEFRDIWQIGGGDTRLVGMKMAKLAFGDISVILNNMTKLEKVTFEELTDGSFVLLKNNAVTSFNRKLTSLVNGYFMFSDCKNLTSFTSELPSLTEGMYMFADCSNLSSFTIYLPNLTSGYGMFSGCKNLTSFTSELPKLTNGESMFFECTNLKSFTSELPKLTNGKRMFSACSNLASFTIELPKLTNGHAMFIGCSNLKSFTIELPSLTDGSYMFMNCHNLSSFTSELSSLTRSWCMFYECTNLTSFTSELPKLTIGENMFKGCKLNKQSVINILTSIPNVNNGTIDIGVGYDYTKDEDTLRAIEEAKNKRWKVHLEFNG